MGDVSRPTLGSVLAGLPRDVPAGRPGDPGRFPPGSVARRMNAETRLLLGGQRALLLQLAEPRVAAGVADHSDFRSDPFGRLWNTLDLTLTVGFGDAEQARAAAARVARTHGVVTGERDGRPYSATDPELSTWIHATLVDSAIVTYERFVGQVAGAARDAYVREMNEQAGAFGVPLDRTWPDHAAFRRYVDGVVEDLEVGDEARNLAAAVLHPPGDPAVRAAGGLLAFVTAGLLPQRVRDGYELPWSERRERALRALAASIRAGGALLPDPLRRWPHARAADARMAAAPAG